MRRELTFYNQIDYPFEAYQVLCWLGDSEDGVRFEEFKNAIFRKFGLDSEHVQKCMALVSDVLQQAEQKFADRMEDIGELFGKIENQMIPADLVVGWTYMMTPDLRVYEDSTGIKQDYERMTPAERDACFFKELVQEMEEKEFDRLVGCEMRGVIVSEAERIRNIFSYIQSMEIKQESKLYIQELYLKREEYHDRMTAFVDEAILLLKEFEGRMLELCVAWSEYWKKVIDAEEFFGKLEDVLELEDNMMTDGFCVMPSVFQCAAMWISANGGLIPSRKVYMTTCRIGVMLMGEFDWNTQAKEEYILDEIVPVLKVLGDKSKAEILLYIKDRPAYGSEIAKQFSLTTATVSHHMNKLLQLRLIQAELRDGRVYYQARKEVLQELFENAKKLFE